MDSDFSHLYSQLNLPPDCTLEELKHAYRRRVAELHPDRRSGVAAGDETEQQLAGLNQQYKTVLRFHRLHGRLPGSVARTTIHRGAEDGRPAPQPTRANGDDSPPVARPAGQEPRKPPLSWWLVAALAIVVFYLLLSTSDETPGAGRPAADANGSTEAAPVEETPARHLALGMDMVTVLEIQGTPTRMESTVWEYGPSWVRFEEGRLVEWYSSPLHQLKTPYRRTGAN